MEVGDLVRLKRPTTKDFNKVFLVTECCTMQQVPWLKVQGHAGWHRKAEFEVIYASR